MVPVMNSIPRSSKLNSFHRINAFEGTTPKQLEAVRNQLKCRSAALRNSSVCRAMAVSADKPVDGIVPNSSTESADPTLEDSSQLGKKYFPLASVVGQVQLLSIVLLTFAFLRYSNI